MKIYGRGAFQPSAFSGKVHRHYISQTKKCIDFILVSFELSKKDCCKFQGRVSKSKAGGGTDFVSLERQKT